jgi:hypothetical protein
LFTRWQVFFQPLWVIKIRTGNAMETLAVAANAIQIRLRSDESLQGFLEELLGRSRVSLSGKPEVDRGAGGIDSTIQVPPVPTLATVCSWNILQAIRLVH